MAPLGYWRLQATPRSDNKQENFALRTPASEWLERHGLDQAEFPTRRAALDAVRFHGLGRARIVAGDRAPKDIFSL